MRLLSLYQPKAEVIRLLQCYIYNNLYLFAVGNTYLAAEKYMAYCVPHKHRQQFATLVTYILCHSVFSHSRTRGKSIGICAEINATLNSLE